MSKWKYFAYDQECGYEEFETEAEALQYAQSSIDNYRDWCDPEWPQEVDFIRVGRITHICHEVHEDISANTRDYEMRPSEDAERDRLRAELDLAQFEMKVISDSRDHFHKTCSGLLEAVDVCNSKQARLRSELDAATKARDAAITEVGNTSRQLGQCQAELDAERARVEALVVLCRASISLHPYADERRQLNEQLARIMEGR